MSLRNIIALLIMAIIIILCVIAAKKVNQKLDSRQIEAAQPASTQPHIAESVSSSVRKTTQELIPLAHLQGPVLVQKDGTAVSFVKVKCKNYTLLNAEEKVKATEATSIAIQSQAHLPLKIIHIQRPVDSTSAVSFMQQAWRARREDIARLDDSPSGRKTASSLKVRNIMLKNMVDDEIAHAKETTRMHADCYIALPVPLSEENESVAHQRARDMAESLRECGFTPEILYPPEIIRLLLDYQGDYRTENESLDPYIFTPLFNDNLEEEHA